MADEVKEKKEKVSRKVEKAVYPEIPKCAAAIDLKYISDHADNDPTVLDWFIKYHEANPTDKFPKVRKAYIETFHKDGFKKTSTKTVGAMEALYQRLKAKK